MTADDNGAEFKLSLVTSHDRSATFIVSDGQILLYFCDRGLWTFVENLSTKVIRYLIDNRQITNRIKKESKSENPVGSESAAIVVYYLRATRLCSTKCELFFYRKKNRLIKIIFFID